MFPPTLGDRKIRGIFLSMADIAGKNDRDDLNSRRWKAERN